MNSKKIFALIIFAIFIFISFVLAASDDVTTNTAAKKATAEKATILNKEIICSINGERQYFSNWAYIAQPEQEIELTIIQNKEEGGKWDSINKAFFSTKGPSNVKVSTTIESDWKVGPCEVLYMDSSQIRFKTPAEPGEYPITLIGSETRSLSQSDKESKKNESEKRTFNYKINLLVCYSFDRNGKGVIDGYPIGVYPNEEQARSSFVQDHKQLYVPPKWFIKVTQENKKLNLSKHFKVGDFFTRTDTEENGFIVIDKRLIPHLESIINELNANNIPGEALKILRAYLTPIEITKLKHKNIEISEFSRYIYGDGVAIIVDANNDSKMDDLNNDGVIDIGDAKVIADVIEKVQRKTRHYGGIGVLSNAANEGLPSQTPYVQTDVRGAYARW